MAGKSASIRGVNAVTTPEEEAELLWRYRNAAVTPDQSAEQALYGDYDNEGRSSFNTQQGVVPDLNLPSRNQLEMPQEQVVPAIPTRPLRPEPEARAAVDRSGSVVGDVPVEAPAFENELMNSAGLPELGQEGISSLDNTLPDDRQQRVAKPFNPNERIIENGVQVPVDVMKGRYDAEVAYQEQRVADNSIDYEGMTGARADFMEQYKRNMDMEGVSASSNQEALEQVFVFNEKSSAAMGQLSIRLTTPDGVENLGTGEDVGNLLAEEFNSSPRAINVAGSEAGVLIFGALLGFKTRGKDKADAIEAGFDYEDMLAETAETDVIHDPNGIGGMIGIEENALFRMAFASTNQRLRASSQTKGADLDRSSVGGEVLTKMWEQAGFIHRVDYQPLQMDTFGKKGPMVKAYMLTHEGLLAAEFTRGFKGMKRLRAEAQAVSAGTPDVLGDIGSDAQKSINNRASGRSKFEVFVKDEGTALQETMAYYASDAVKTFDPESIATYQLLVSAAANGEANSDGKAESPFVQELKPIAQKILKMPQKMEVTEPKMGNGEPVPTPIPMDKTNKFKKAMNDIRNAKKLQKRTTTKVLEDGTVVASHKTPTFYDPSTGRVYYMTSDSNGQESRIFRGSVTGLKSDVSIGLMPEKLNNLSVVTSEQIAQYNNWLKGDGPATAASRYVSYMTALGNLLIRGSRDFSNESTLQQLSGNVIRQAASKGRSLRKFIEMNAEAQEKALEDVKQGVVVEGLTPAEQGDILNMLDEIIDSGNEKEAGLQIRAYTVAATIEDAHLAGKSTVFISLPSAADMKSAGRLFAAVDILDVHTVSRVGIAMNEVAGMAKDERDFHHAFPVGNPRMFYTNALIAGMKSTTTHPRGVKGLVEFTSNFSNTIAVYMEQMLDKQGPAFSDMVAKLTLMVADYGKASSQNSDEVKLFLEVAKGEHPGLFAEMEATFKKGGFAESDINRFFEEAMWQTTTKIVGTTNSRTIKLMAQSMALFNIQPYYIGYGNKKQQIGRGVQQVLPESTMAIQTQYGNQVFELRAREFTNDPLQKSPGKMLENGVDYYQAGIASAAVNAMGPAMGHSRESAAMALALQMVVARLGDGIFLDQVYDSITLEPEAAMLYEYYLNEFALFKVLEVNDAHQLYLAWHKEVWGTMNDIKSAGTVTLGPEGEYKGWSSKLDEEWEALIREVPIDKVKNDNFQKNIDRAEVKIANKLKAAQDAGVWRPPSEGTEGGAKITVRGHDFITRPPKQKVYEVDSKAFNTWIERYVLREIKHNAKKLFRASDSKQRKDFLANMKKVWLKAFQKGGLAPKWELPTDVTRYDTSSSFDYEDYNTVDYSKTERG